MIRFDSSEIAELAALSNEFKAVSLQQLSINSTYCNTAIAEFSSMHYNSVEQDQSDKFTHHVIDQFYNCIANSFEASEDQDQTFFLDSFRIHQYENADYELNHDTSFIEQSQLLIQNSFDDCSSHALFSSILNDRNLQFSQRSLVIYNNDHESYNASTAHNALSFKATEFHIDHLI